MYIAIVLGCSASHSPQMVTVVKIRPNCVRFDVQIFFSIARLKSLRFIVILGIYQLFNNY